MTLYKISPAQAAAIGKFEYSPGKSFDPFVHEQKDGTFLVSDTMYELLKDTDQFKAVDFTSLTTITVAQMNNKTVSNPR